jgi:serine/threonine protein kinase
MPDLAHGVRQRPTPGIVRPKLHTPSCNSEYTLDKETRQVQPGTRLGPYEVVAQIGAGGMGEVYRARDTRLGRDVAIKVLPVSLTPVSRIGRQR